jgi:hypothetical protein
MGVTTRFHSHTKDELEKELARSYLLQRTGIAILGLIFPLGFLASCYLLGRTEFQPSISEYYWAPLQFKTQLIDLERNFFVGVLCAVAVFLVLYKECSNSEYWVLNIAGVAALGVAFFPTSNYDIPDGFRAIGFDIGDKSFTLHGLNAVVFFVCISFVCIHGAFVSLKQHIPDACTRRTILKWVYLFSAAMMIANIIVVFLAVLLGSEFGDKHFIFWVESVGIWAFALYWYAKTRELDSAITFVPLKPLFVKVPPAAS